jgi:ATP-dependent DNA ligase
MADTGNGGTLVFFLFDLLHLDGEPVSARPLKERKEPLPALLSDVPSPLQFSDHRNATYSSNGRGMFNAYSDHSEATSAEGIASV